MCLHTQSHTHTHTVTHTHKHIHTHPLGWAKFGPNFKFCTYEVGICQKVVNECKK